MSDAKNELAVKLALKVDEVSISLAKKEILHQISVALEKGKTLAVVGHNGAGKTTLFHIILGLKFATKGTIELFGKSSFDSKSREQVGYVPERPYLYDYDSLEGALFYFSNLLNLDKAEATTRVKSAIEQVGLAGREKDKLKTFSKGMLQRTLIAQSLLGKPELLILDEPMSGLDPGGREFVRQWMHTWKASGKTLIFSTHTLEDVSLVADYVLALEQGKIQYFGPLEGWKA